MILRRIASAFKRQDWSSIAVEFVLVVIGVFVALQVNTWAQRQADKRDYYDAIDRLRGEIAANLETIETAEGEVSIELPKVRTALDALDTCSDDAETRQKVNDGLAFLEATSGFTQRASALRELTSSGRLLAVQSASIRRRLSDLLFILEIVDREVRYAELRPLDTRLENIGVLSLSPWRVRREARYLGEIDFSGDYRFRELNVPVSFACKDEKLIGALWTWVNWQSDLGVYVKTMREEYRLTLELLDEELSN